MNISYFKIILLKELISALYDNKNSKKIIKSISSKENVKCIIVGNLEIQTNNNSIPFFCFNDNTTSIKCHLLNFKKSWLSNVLYSENWSLINSSSDSYYLEIHSFSLLTENIGVFQYYERNYQENFKLLNKTSFHAWVDSHQQKNQKNLVQEFKCKTFPLIEKSFISDKYTKYFQNGLTLVGRVDSKSSLQLMKQDHGTSFFFVIELKIEPLDNILPENQENTKEEDKDKNKNLTTTTFIIFRMHEMTEILIYYHLLKVKKTYIFQNLFLHTIKLSNPVNVLSKNIFQFIHTKSHFEKLKIPKSNSLKTSLEKNDLNRITIDLTNESDSVEASEQNNTPKEPIEIDKDNCNCSFFNFSETISYTGMITKIINNHYAIYELDNKFILSLSHYPIDIQFCSLRPGAELILHNVHLFSLQTLDKSKLCFIACKRSSIELKSFSKNLSWDVMKCSIIHKEDVSQYNSIDIIYLTYIIEWLKYYLYPNSNDNSIPHINNLSQQILFYSGYKDYQRQDFIREILYHHDYCDLARPRYSLPYLINIKTILNNNKLIHFLFQRLNNLTMEFESCNFTQEDLGLSNTWLIGLLDTTSTGKFRVFDKNHYIFLHIEDLRSSSSLSWKDIGKPILIKKFNVSLDFICNDKPMIHTSTASKSPSPPPPPNPIKAIFNMTSDTLASKRFILLKHFSSNGSNKFIDENDSEFLSYFKIYLSVSLKNIYILKNQELSHSPSSSPFDTPKTTITPTFNINHSVFPLHQSQNQNDKNNQSNHLLLTHYINHLNINVYPSQSVLGSNDDQKPNYNNCLLIFKINHISPVKLVGRDDKDLKFVSELFGSLISLQKLFTVPHSYPQEDKHLSFYTITREEDKILELSYNALKMCPFLMVNKCYRFTDDFSYDEKKNTLLLDKPNIEEVNLFIYKKENNSNNFQPFDQASPRFTKIKFVTSIPQRDSYLLYEPALPKKYRHLLIYKSGNNNNEEVIYHLPIKFLIRKEDNIKPIYTISSLSSSSSSSPPSLLSLSSLSSLSLPPSSSYSSSSFPTLNDQNKEEFLNLISFPNTKRCNFLLNVNDVLKIKRKNDMATSKDQGIIVSFIGIIVGIHTNHNDKICNEKRKNFESKLFLKNIGIGDPSAILILEVRDMYTPDILNVFLKLNRVEYPYGLNIGNFIRLDNIYLTYSLKSNESSFYCESFPNTKIHCYSNHHDNLTLLLCSENLFCSPHRNNGQLDPVPTISKISKPLLQNIKTKYLIDLYDTENSFCSYYKFRCEIKEITEIYFIHKCKLCHLAISDGNCPNQNQHYLNQNSSMARINRKRKNEDDQHSHHSQQPRSSDLLCRYNRTNKCEYCEYGVIEAKLKCIVEDGTAVAELEMDNIEAIYRVLKLQNINSATINRCEFEKYMCHKGIVQFYKEKNSKEVKNKNFSEFINGSSYFIESKNDNAIYNKLQSMLILPSLLRPIVAYGKRIGYYTNEYFKSSEGKKMKKSEDQEKKEKPPEDKKRKNSQEMITNGIFEKFQKVLLKSSGINLNTIKKVDAKLYCIYVEDMSYSNAIFEMINNTI